MSSTNMLSKADKPYDTSTNTYTTNTEIAINQLCENNNPSNTCYTNSDK